MAGEIMAPDKIDQAGDLNSPFSPVTVPEYPSQAMRTIIEQIRTFARSELDILLLGESGSGKDHLAGLIHEMSGKAGPLIMVDCPGMDKNVIQSELFGHETGAYTGAESDKKGLVELADGGTLFLNEIGELPLDLQSKLLTFLDKRQFYRMGGVRRVNVRIRVIAATNRVIEDDVRNGKFREDLYYRLNPLTIMMPPLRDRIEDVPILVEEILVTLSQKTSIKEIPVVDPESMQRLTEYAWPGNIRELKNVLLRGILAGQRKRVELAWFNPIRNNSRLESGKSEEREIATAQPHAWSWNSDFPEHELDKAVRSFRIAAIDEALRRTRGKKGDAARLLGIDRHTLDRILKSR